MTIPIALVLTRGPSLHRLPLPARDILGSERKAPRTGSGGRLSHTRVVQIAYCFGQPGVRTTKAYQGDIVREDESAGDQMISKMGRQTVRYAG